MPRFPRPLFALLAVACLPFALRGVEPPTIEQFFAQPTFSMPKLSPDGKRLAVVGQQDGTEYLAILDLTTMQPRPMGFFKDSHLRNCWWTGDRRILLEVETQNFITQYRTIDPESGKATEMTGAFHRGLSGDFYVVQSLPGDSENVLVENADAFYARNIPRTLSKLNLVTRKVVRVETAPGNFIQWVVNRRGEAVAALGNTERQAFLTWKKPDGWQQTALGPDQDLKMQILAIHPDQHRLLVKDTSGPGMARIVALDPATMAKETLFQPSDVDPDGTVTWGENDPTPYAIRFQAGRMAFHYLDEDAQSLMATVDRSLPETVNEIVSASADHARLIIQSSNERLKGMFYFLDRSAGRLVPLGAMLPDLPPPQLLTGRAFEFKARDGLAIHGRITLPAATGQKPPLLLILWGPIRSPSSQVQFNAWIQLLASRGYAVATIDYRGVSGRGREFEKAGDRQFGTGMPGDVEDGTRWLIDQNLVDEKQVGIIGCNAAGLIAFQALLHSPLFTVWVNVNTPMLPYDLDKLELLSNENDAERIVSKMGGANAVHDYLSTIEPRAQLSQVKVPSFHYYDRRADNSFVGNGEIAESFSKKTSAPSLFVRGKSHANVFEYFSYDFTRLLAEQQITIFSQLLPFLQKNLPVTAAKAAAGQ